MTYRAHSLMMIALGRRPAAKAEDRAFVSVGAGVIVTDATLSGGRDGDRRRGCPGCSGRARRVFAVAPDPCRRDLRDPDHLPAGQLHRLAAHPGPVAFRSTCPIAVPRGKEGPKGERGDQVRKDPWCAGRWGNGGKPVLPAPRSCWTAGRTGAARPAGRTRAAGPAGRTGPQGPQGAQVFRVLKAPRAIRSACAATSPCSRSTPRAAWRRT